MRNYVFHPLNPRPFPAYSGPALNSAIAAGTFVEQHNELANQLRRRHGPADVDVFMEGYLYPSKRASREHRGRLLLHVQKTGRLPGKSEAKRIWNAVKESARGVREFLGDRCPCGSSSTGAALMALRNAHPGLCACNHSHGSRRRAEAAGVWDAIKSGASTVGNYIKQKLSGGSFTSPKPSTGGVYIDNRNYKPPADMGQNIHSSIVQPPGGMGAVPLSMKPVQLSNLPSSVVDMQHSLQKPPEVVQHNDYTFKKRSNSGWENHDQRIDRQNEIGREILAGHISNAGSAVRRFFLPNFNESRF